LFIDVGGTEFNDNPEPEPENVVAVKFPVDGFNVKLGENISANNN